MEPNMETKEKSDVKVDTVPASKPNGNETPPRRNIPVYNKDKMSVLATVSSKVIGTWDVLSCNLPI
jgi:hypothetical protein